MGVLSLVVVSAVIVAVDGAADDGAVSCVWLVGGYFSPFQGRIPAAVQAGLATRVHGGHIPTDAVAFFRPFTCIGVSEYGNAGAIGASLCTEKLAIALHETSDSLLFETDERGSDDRLCYQFDTISRMRVEDREPVRGLLDAVICETPGSGAIARAAGPADQGKE
nr:hypothetical protein [Pseudomonas sp. Marseille-Q5115]